MAKIWREPVDPERHRDYMGGGYRDDGALDAGGWQVDPAKTDGWIYFVRVCAFTFCFVSLSQLEEARAYFAKRVHPARRRAGVSLEHYWQRWYERLPAGLCGGSKRTRVLRALDEAARQFSGDHSHQ
jgi:hypothetical protein